MIIQKARSTGLEPVIELLIEGFEETRGLQRLRSGQVISDSDPLRWWRPAFDIYIGIRTIASYIISRNRLHFLKTILPRFITKISIDDAVATKVPILFWPFHSLQFPEFTEGRAEFFWKERVGAAWGDYFANVDHFLRSSAQLDFLLEFNSYFGVNFIKDPKLKTWLAEFRNPQLFSFRYLPDLYKKDLQDTMPMAERVYGILTGTEHFPPHLAIDAALLDIVFYGKAPHERLAIYGEFLLQLLTWQADVRLRWFNYWGFAWSWPGRLGELVNEARAKSGTY